MSTRRIQAQVVEFSKLYFGYESYILMQLNILTELRSYFIVCKLVFCKIDLKSVFNLQ
jgi:hypothetical protein